MMLFSVLILFCATRVSAQRKLFEGRQRQLFLTTNITAGCDAALNTTLNCPRTIHMLTYPDYAIRWNTTMLQALCTSSCLSDSQILATRLSQSCQNDRFTNQLGNTSFSDFGSLIRYRTSQLCLRESESTNSRFCRDVKSTFDVRTLVANGSATWPTIPPKCYYDGLGTCVTIDSQPVDNSTGGLPPWMFPGSAPKAPNDVWMDRTDVMAQTNRGTFGWDRLMNYDEYPLQVQCQRCFWKPWALQFGSRYGQRVWTEIEQQIWTNIVRNCGITGADAIVTPYKNLSGTYFAVREETEPPEKNWSLCPSTTVVPTTATDTCKSFVVRNSLPMAGLRNMNEGMTCLSVAGQKLCLPLRCPIVVINETISVAELINSGTLPGVTLLQFLTWNLHMSRTTNIVGGDTVCKGPARGDYTPSVVSVAHPTVFTTTATPAAPTPPRTIGNCGLYHIITGTDTCPELTIRYKISFSQFIDLNPTIDSECSNLAIGRAYCVAPVNGTNVPHQTTTSQAVPRTSTSSTSRPLTPGPSSTGATSSTRTTTSTSTNGIPTPTPTQPGVVSNCYKFDLVRAGDTCQVIATRNSITLAQLYSWNTGISNTCGGLWASTYVCTGIFTRPSYQLYGCFTEVPTRALSYAGITGHQSMTIEYCAVYCIVDRGRSLFGVQFGRECWCGDALTVGSVQAPNQECNMACTGNNGQICGGNSRLNVYGRPDRPPAIGYRHYGCYTEGTNTRALGIANTASNSMTVAFCADFCFIQRNTAHFGVQNGRECFCGNNLGIGAVATATSDCSAPCSGNSAQTCGAANRLNLYSKSATTPPMNFRYQGCFTEITTRALTGPNIIGDTAMTIEKCAKFCIDRSNKMFGVQFGSECFCGTQRAAGSVSAPEGECNMDCAGNPDQVCGARSRLSIYLWN